MKSKSILYISPNIDKFGAERSLITIMKYQKAIGNKVLLVIPTHGDIENLLKAEKLEYIVIKFYLWVNNGLGKRLFYGIGKYVVHCIQSYRIKQILTNQNFKPNIVHTNVITTDIGYHIAKRYKCNHVWHIREFGKLDFNMDFDLGNSISRLILETADIIITNSNAVKNYYSLLINPKKLQCVYNGIDISKPCEHNFTNQILSCIMVGRLGKEKNHADAIKAIALLIKDGITNIHLDIFGKGVFEEQIKKIIIDFNIHEYISLKGFSDTINYSQYEVGLMCSHHEAFGRVTVEYMMAGVIPIGADSGGTKELINKDYGLIFQAGNSIELAKCLKWIIMNKYKCSIMSKTARQVAINFFSTDNYCKNITNIYNTLN